MLDSLCILNGTSILDMQLAEAMAADSAIRHGDDPGDLGIAGEARDRCPAVDRLDTRLDGVVAEEEYGLLTLC